MNVAWLTNARRRDYVYGAQAGKPSRTQFALFRSGSDYFQTGGTLQYYLLSYKLNGEGGGGQDPPPTKQPPPPPPTPPLPLEGGETAPSEEPPPAP
jgi:hypothetical protein